MEPQQLGKYQLIRKLATGGMAEVFLAKAAGPMGFQKTLVVKRILPHLAEDPEFVAMFLAEAKIAAELNHPNIVQIFDFGEQQGTYFIAMEFIDGPNLRELTRRAQNIGLPMPIPLAAKIISQACEGLAFAHDHTHPETGRPLNLIHRDMSPDNIILSRSGIVKVVDFGVAKVATNRGLTRSGMVKGKMSYMAPEQLADEPLDRRADVFALGIVFFELLTGQLPFEDRNDPLIIQALMSLEPFPPVVRFRPEVPPALARILSRALEKDVSARYASAKALQSDLERFILSLGEPVQTYDLARLVERLEDPSPVTEPRMRAPLDGTLTAPELERTDSPPSAEPRARTPRPERHGSSRPPERPPEPFEMVAESEPLTMENLPIEHEQDDADPMAETQLQLENPVVEVTQRTASLAVDPSEEENSGIQDKTEPILNHSSYLLESLVSLSQVETRELVSMQPAEVTDEVTVQRPPRRATPRRQAVVVGAIAAVVVVVVIAVLVATGALGGSKVRSVPLPSDSPGGTTSVAKPLEPPAPTGDATAKPSGGGNDVKPAVGDREAAKPGRDDVKPVVGDGDAKPTMGGDVKSAVGGDVKPAVGGEAKPAAGDSGVKPAAGDGEAKPTGDSEVKPASGDVAPLAPVDDKDEGSRGGRDPRKPAGVKPRSHHPAATASMDKAKREPGHEVAEADQGTVEFRIRPYAQVFLDGRSLGQTPFAPVTVSAGKHMVRLVNAKLGRDTTVEYTVKPNEENVFKYNLREE